jgi:hypothetical protein
MGGLERREVVSVAVAEAELVAVRDLLSELGSEVAAEERAADIAERRAAEVSSSVASGHDALERSRHIVDEMAVQRQAEWRDSYERARAEADARLAEASRRAAALIEAASRETTQVLESRTDPDAPKTRFPVPPGSAVYPPVLRPEPRGPKAITPTTSQAPPPSAPPVSAAPAPEPAPAAALAPALAGWAPASAPPSQRTPVLPDLDEDVEFWREATEAEAATNRTVRAVTSLAPVEAILPAVALLLLLVAVLLLIG